jgi:hypothetical protein
MADQAQVTSVDAIEAFRASLVLYLSKAKPAVEQVGAEMMRTRVWVQSTQRQYWENQMRLRKRKLEEAQGQLFNARISQFQQSTLLETMAVQRAQRAVTEAEGKLALLKKWSLDIETRADPLVKQLDQFHSFLLIELNQAVAYLGQIVKTLDAYTDSVPTASSASSAAAPASVPEPAPAEKETTP